MSINLQDKSRFSRFLLGALCFLCVLLYASPPGLPGAQTPEQSGQAFSIRVDVELVTIELAALDKKGNPVRNLKKEDFRLYEDGKQQSIYSFDEISDERAMPSANFADIDPGHGKIILILFDDSTILTPHIKSSRDSAEKFVREHMRPQDLFAVASFGMSLKILQNFTRDIDKVLQAIAQPAISSATPNRQQDASSRQPSTGATMDSTRQWPGQSRGYDPSGTTMTAGAGYQAENLLRALDSLSMSVERLKGQKSVLVYSESGFFNMNTVQTIYSKTLNSAKRSNVIFYTIDPGGLNTNAVGEIRSNRGASASGKLASKRNVFQPLSFLRTSGAMSMASSMFQKGGGGGGTGGGKGGGTGSGSGSGTGGSTGSTSGSTGSTGGYGTGRSGSPGSTNYPTFGNADLNSQNSAQQNLLRSLALETGGSSIYNTNNYDEELTKLDQQLSNYYILGFQSNNPKHDGQFRKIEVKTEVQGVTLKHRKGYLDRRPVDILASSKHEKTLLKAMASPDAATQIPIVLRAAYFYDSPRIAKVIVATKIPMAKVELKKKGGEVVSDLNVMGVAYGEDGGVSARFSETLHVAVEKEKEQDLRKARLGYRNYFKLRPGKYRLKLATSDDANNLGSVEQTLEVPTLPESGMAGSSLVLAEEVSRLPDLIRDLQTKLLDDSEPLLFSGMQVSPSVDNKLPVGAPLPVFFKLYNFNGGGADRTKLSAKARLLDEKGEERSAASIPMTAAISQTGAAESAVGFSIPFQDISPGKYKLSIEVSDGLSPKPVTFQTDVEYIKK